MDSVVLLIGCIFLASAVALVFFAALALSSVRRAPKPERLVEEPRDLGRWLQLSHPEWQQRSQWN